MTEREAFEAHITRFFSTPEAGPFNPEKMFYRVEGGRYFKGWLQSQWEGWQARAAAEDGANDEALRVAGAAGLLGDPEVLAAGVKQMKQCPMACLTYGQCRAVAFGIPAECGAGVQRCRAEQRVPSEWTCDCAEPGPDCKPTGVRRAYGVEGGGREPTPCNWSMNIDDDAGMWETSCGEAFVFNDGGPSANFMRFCCYCGKPLREHRYSDDEPDGLEGGGREPSPARLRWCNHCGEGVTDFCRGKSEACPMQFKKLRAAGLDTGISGEGERND